MGNKERPIIFNGDMVKAILDGRKTQTRRVIKPQPPSIWDRVKWLMNRTWCFENSADPDFHGYKDCPYGKPGDQLWVRETFCQVVDPFTGGAVAGIGYKADRDFITGKGGEGYFKEGSTCFNWEKPDEWKYKPSIHMPHWASRINLLVKDIRVERVQDISYQAAINEGIEKEWDGTAHWYKNYISDELGMFKQNPRASFQTLWDSINAKRGYGWEVNPWVFVISFERLDYSKGLG